MDKLQYRSVVFSAAGVELATAALNLVNGYDFKGKPIIIEYGKQNNQHDREQVETLK